MSDNPADGRSQQEKLEYLKRLERDIYVKENLPHLFGNNMYGWQRDFFYTKKKNAFLCAANQIGKTEIQGRRLINLATLGDDWKDWFKVKPDCFWYLLPSKEMIEAIVDLKWVPNLLPRGSFREHPKYGWELKKAHGSYNSIHFNSGVRIYFKSYAMGADVLQSATCDYIAFDEELPWDLYSELNARRTARDGYLSGVLTPTIGQEEWRRVFEEIGTDIEVFPNAFKRNVSMYDCLSFADGEKTGWTEERIQNIINSCATDQEVQRRVYGRFVKNVGLVYPQFSPKENVKPYHKLPLSSGYVYSGVDPGAGDLGGGSHPASIVFVWVNNEMNKLRIFSGWKSPKGMALEPRDLLAQYAKMKQGIVVSGEYYDWKNKDFETVATRSGFAFQKANKARDYGHQIINLLFKTKSLIIYDLLELRPLIHELMTYSLDTPKRSAKDDFIDAMRYAITSIPLNWKSITDIKIIPECDNEANGGNKFIDMRMNPPDDIIDTAQTEFESEINFWNKMYEGL